MRTCVPCLTAPAQGPRALHAIVYSLFAALAIGAALCGPGCGRELIPIPIPCPACVDTAESLCREFKLEDGTRLRSQYSPGDPNLPLLIAVSGFGGSYDDVTLVFPKGSYPTLSFSLPGHRCSDPLPKGKPYSVAIGADALEKLLEYNHDLLEQFGADNVLILGASFGGFIVAEYFARHPECPSSAVLVISQDFAPNEAVVDIIAAYLTIVSTMFPLTDNAYLLEYLNSARDFDVRAGIARTRNRWLIIGAADDELVLGARDMAERLGARARYAEVPGGHFDMLKNVDRARQIVTEQLDFLLPAR